MLVSMVVLSLGLGGFVSDEQLACPSKPGEEEIYCSVKCSSGASSFKCAMVSEIHGKSKAASARGPLRQCTPKSCCKAMDPGFGSGTIAYAEKGSCSLATRAKYAARAGFTGLIVLDAKGAKSKPAERKRFFAIPVVTIESKRMKSNLLELPGPFGINLEVRSILCLGI
jgi:hypothetical protein